MKKIAVFASGSGSNFQAIADAIKAGKLNAKIGLLVCDRPEAFVVERAGVEQIPLFVFTPGDYPGKKAYEEVILQELKGKEIDFIVLAGYMRLVGATLLNAYEGRIVNIHPSLLPAFPGRDAVGQAIAAKVKVSGVTIHYVDEGMDTGPIIAQQAVQISDEETKSTLQDKIQQVEHRLYPEVLEQIMNKKIGFLPRA
ncbi:phosphoribosylglycinamide formyltransferase [Bacillus sp. T33-2]|uniref:phosphoribosylglycinamide formyltransferase n=1 Tax=Bacillus sp. T33-2 TaxID=2054168 RepID=UPI000C75E166|nr:phosphoribosylglycinamide formyltransferase [Bacillus sp. T33-2]PLR99204.1 phosphoribosylglycinamide formyltransferase [Bacillus sp. T33-2]